MKEVGTIRNLSMASVFVMTMLVVTTISAGAADTRSAAGSILGDSTSFNMKPGVSTSAVDKRLGGPPTTSDHAVRTEDKTIDGKLKSICRGC